MSNSESFWNTVLNDPDLRRKAFLAMRNNDSGAIEKLAQDSGFPCTHREIADAFRFGADAGTFDVMTLSDEELEAVAAGYDE